MKDKDYYFSYCIRQNLIMGYFKFVYIHLNSKTYFHNEVKYKCIHCIYILNSMLI